MLPTSTPELEHTCCLGISVLILASAWLGGGRNRGPGPLLRTGGHAPPLPHCSTRARQRPADLPQRWRRRAWMGPSGWGDWKGRWGGDGERMAASSRSRSLRPALGRRAPLPCIAAAAAALGMRRSPNNSTMPRRSGGGERGAQLGREAERGFAVSHRRRTLRRGKAPKSGSEWRSKEAALLQIMCSALMSWDLRGMNLLLAGSRLLYLLGLVVPMIVKIPPGMPIKWPVQAEAWVVPFLDC